jgi:hypothetical protein
LPLLRIPDPVTVAFVGYWLSPLTSLIKAVASFLSSQHKPLVDRVLVLTNLVVGCACFSIWAVACAIGNGRFLPVSPSGVDLVLGVSGLTLYLASVSYALIAYGLGRKLDIDLWLTRWMGLAVIVGIVVWALKAGLN